MAKKLEEIKAQNAEEANKALGDQLNLVSSLQDKMTDLIKIYREKGTLDKLSLDNIKAVTAATKAYKSEYNSVKEVQKDISRNTQLQNDIAKQTNALTKKGGDGLKDEMKMLATKKQSLSDQQAKLAAMDSKKKQGVKIDEALYKQAQNTVIKKEEQLKLAHENLTPEAQQLLLLQEAGKALEGNNVHLKEQLNRQQNLIKSQSLFTSAIGGTSKFLNKLGFGNLSKKLGLDTAKQAADELTYRLTDGGKKSLGMFGKMRVAAFTFGTALKTALGPMALISMAISAGSFLFQKFKQMGAEALEYMKEISQETANMTREMGVGAAAGAKLAGQARAIGGAMGMTHQQSTAAAGAIYSQLAGAESLGASTLKTFMKLNVHGNVSADTLSKIHGLSKLSGKAAGKVAQEIAKAASHSIKSLKVNISMRAVMEGVAKVSNRVALSMGGSGKAITASVVQAKKLGLEMEQVESIANSLLNIEDSIAAEMEAELLTGKELNLEKAREAALSGDNVALMAALADQGITAADYSKMNRIQQEALGKAMGMNGDQLGDMLSNQEKSKATNTELVASQNAGVAAMTSQASLAETIANAEDARKASMGPIGAMFLQFQNAMREIATALMPVMVVLFQEIWNIVWPLFEGVKNWLTDSKNVKMMTDGIKGAFSGIKEFLTPIFEMLGQLAIDMVPVILSIWEKIQPVVFYVKDLIIEIVGSVGSLLNKLATGNGEFTKMEKLVGAVGIGLIAIKGTMMAINLYKKAMVKWEKIQLGYAKTKKLMEKASLRLTKGKLAVQKLLGKENIKAGAQMVKNAAFAAKDFIKSVGLAIMKAVSSLSAIPVIGFGLGIAAGATIAGLAAKYMNDGIIPPSTGKGGRTLFSPEGSINFNDKDTIVAGTDLFGNSSKSQTSSAGGESMMIMELQKVTDLLQQLLSKEGNVMIDGNKVGVTLSLANYRQQ
jgi:hypothetical protein